MREIYLVGESITFKALVTNIGTTYSGKEVVQLYFSAPTGELDKPYQELIAFGKTDELAQKESQLLKLTFSVKEMSSYCEARAAHLLQPY